MASTVATLKISKPVSSQIAIPGISLNKVNLGLEAACSTRSWLLVDLENHGFGPETNRKTSPLEVALKTPILSLRPSSPAIFGVT